MFCPGIVYEVLKWNVRAALSIDHLGGTERVVIKVARSNDMHKMLIRMMENGNDVGRIIVALRRDFNINVKCGFMSPGAFGVAFCTIGDDMTLFRRTMNTFAMIWGPLV